MAILNSWQRIDRVLPGMVWGDGASGSATISSDPNTRATLVGTATQSTATIGSAILSDGDVVVCHQTQGMGNGQWEINRVASGGGTTSLTMQVALQYTYSTGAQIIKVPRYTTATVSAHSVTAWNSSTGGVEVICAKTSITVSGALNGSGLGQRGGGGGNFGAVGNTGDGTDGNSIASSSRRGTGGGGTPTDTDPPHSAGAGGGHTNAGTNGPTGHDGASQGGTTGGSADATTIIPGGAGGGGKGLNDGSWHSGGTGGGGGGVMILISKSVTLNAGVSVNGANGQSVTEKATGGGGGAGGHVLVICDTASLGTNQITSTAGSGGTSATEGGAATAGAGSIGRVTVHHKGTVTGTSNPTFTDVTDTSLKEAYLGSFIFNLL